MMRLVSSALISCLGLALVAKVESFTATVQPQQQQRSLSSSISFSTSTTLVVNGETAVKNNASDDVVDVDTYVRCGKCQTAYPITENELGGGRGRRLECSVCGHTWFQSKDRVMSLKQGFEMIELPQDDLERIQENLSQGKPAGFLGEAKVYVGNVPFECHEDDLMVEFSKVGEVGEVSLVRDEEGRNRGFGFVTMRTKEGGQAAIEQVDGAVVRGRRIAVRDANH